MSTTVIGPTTMSKMVNPEVMGDMINAKIDAQLKLTPYAKVDTSLVGVPGDTKTVPAWTYIGDATNVDENTAISFAEMSASTKDFKIGKAGKGVQITTEAINSGLGNPVGQAETQLAKAIASKVDVDVLDAALTATVSVGDGTAVIGYAGIVDAVTKFEDEEDGIEKVMFISPKQEATLLKDPDFLSADKFTSGVAVNGAIGKIAGCWIKKSNRIVAKSGVFTNPIIKLEPDSADTEYTEDELPAITIFLKKDTTVNAFYDGEYDRTNITAYRYYGVALTNDAKVVLAKFKA
jgi:N4-gp56 family major capsid protein